MVLPAFIEKFPDFLRGKDFEFLREKILDYLRQMASENWTDHNIHDPGITMAEMLCYAITDLGYKTDFSMQDILAEKTLCNWDSNKVSKNTPNLYYTVREILPCNPVTISDYRKVMMDVPGIKNAWLLMLKKSIPALYLDCKNSELTYDYRQDRDRINLQGLYNALMEFDKDPMLGDLNLWRYKFPLNGTKTDKWVTLYLQSIWHIFRFKHITVEDIKKIYVEEFKSIPHTSLYEGAIILKTENDKVRISFNLESPLEKNDPNKSELDLALVNLLPDLLDYLKDRIRRCLTITRGVYQNLHRQRSLCEDYVDFLPVEVEEIGVCADLEIRTDGDMEKILAHVYKAMEDFFCPPIPFYSLEDLQDKGLTLDEIFTGPALKHGFLLEDDVSASDFKTEVHVSDLIQILMDIQGVLAVKDIQLSKYFQGEIIEVGQRWIMNVTDNMATRFYLDKSKFVFYKNLTPYKAKKEEALDWLKDLNRYNNKPRLKADDYDVQVPTGIDQGLQNYHSIQEDFPLVYGIGQEGLPPSATPIRKAQAKQLKAYLYLVDQILSNYCSQLAHVKDLFSIDPNIKRTYFSQKLFTLPESFQITLSTLRELELNSWTPDKLNLLQPVVDEPGFSNEAFIEKMIELLGADFYLAQKDLLFKLCKLPEITVPDVPNGANLNKDFVLSHSGPDYQDINWNEPNTYHDYWYNYRVSKKQDLWDNLCERNPLLESSKTYEDRKNRFLDHLMARFAEQFSDYVLLTSHQEGPRAPEELIKDKMCLLQDYPVISRDRARAFNCLKFDKDNVSGLEARVSRLAGINDWTRTRLAPDIESFFKIYPENDSDPVDEYRFRLINANGNIMLSSSTDYPSRVELNKEMESVILNGKLRNRYIMKQTKKNRYYFNLGDETGEVIARRIQYFDTLYEAEKALHEVIDYIKSFEIRSEGFHLLEHILLRPYNKDYDKLAVCVEEDCECCLGFRDPYSFRVTAVLPYWPERFENMDFRRFFERTLRSETPAHIHVKICWVDQTDMKNFENAYFKWLEDKTKKLPTDPDFISCQNKLIEELEKIRSVYPETHLHDCEDEGEDTSPILLNHSKLGSTKEIENGSM